LLGLGGISKKIKETIEKVQNFVDKAIDKAIAKIVAVVKKLFGGAKDDKPDERSEAQKAQDVDSAIKEGTTLLQEDPDGAESSLGMLKQKYRLAVLEVRKDAAEEDAEVEHVYGAASPGKDGKKVKVVKKLPAIEVQFTFNKENKNLKFSEYQSQLKGQQDG